MPYGVCASGQCELSSQSQELTTLFELIATIDRRGQEGRPLDNLDTLLQRYARFFQPARSVFCAMCGRPLILNTQPTLAIVDQNEKTIIERTNQLLGAGFRLQSMGILPE